MSRRDTIWKWVFYTAGVLLLLLLQGLALDHISLLHVHPYLPPVMVAVLAMFEGAYGGMGVALTMGLLFDLTQPGLIPCFHILAFLLAAVSVILFVPVFLEYLNTGLVPRFPTLIASGFILLAGIQSFFSGMMLEVMAAKDRKDFEYRLNRVHGEHQERKGL